MTIPFISPTYELLKDYYQLIIDNNSNNILFIVSNSRTIIPSYQQRSPLSAALTQNEGNSHDYINYRCKHRSQ